jgi:hypothetical protein
MSVNGQTPLDMNLVNSDANSNSEVTAIAGIYPDLAYDYNSDSDSGSGTPESALSDCWYLNGASVAHLGCSAVTMGWQESVNAQYASHGVSGKAETGMLLGTYTGTNGWAYSWYPFDGEAEALYEIGEYSGPDDAWIEGEIVFWQYKFDQADINFGDWNLTGSVIVGQTELSYQVEHDGDIHVTGVKSVLGDEVVVDETFEASNGFAGGSITFREYVVPGITSINVYSGQLGYAEIITHQNDSGHIGWWPNPAKYGASVICEAYTGTPD